MALWRRKSPLNFIVHADRGSQYCSADYQALLKRHNLRGSMSAKGCCYDNACAKTKSRYGDSRLDKKVNISSVASIVHQKKLFQFPAIHGVK
ncbi:TPA: hypothetical protein IGN28_004712 [Escherichia coli]|nr:hypothetical protein [Escherichia coli]